jgi:hypothetical protein
VQQVGAQGHRAAVVVRDDGRVAELPMIEQVGEQFSLHSKGNVLPIGLAR